MCPKIRCDILEKKIWKVNQAKLIDVEAVKLRVWRKQVLSTMSFHGQIVGRARGIEQLLHAVPRWPVAVQLNQRVVLSSLKKYGEMSKEVYAFIIAGCTLFVKKYLSFFLIWNDKRMWIMYYESILYEFKEMDNKVLKCTMT